MRNKNLLKLVLVTLVIIAVTAGGGCIVISGGTDNSTPTTIPTTQPATTVLAQIRPFPTEATGITNATPDEISFWLTSSSQQFHIIDVRTASEYSDAHIRGAINIDVSAADFTQNIDKLDKQLYYIVYCRTGVRSAQASKIMLDHEFIHIINMTGGITEWLNENLDNLQKAVN